MKTPDAAKPHYNGCSYCGYLDWTVEKYGRVTHKEGCPMRTDPWHQGDLHPENRRSAAYARKRRSDWIVALVMLVGGVVPSGLMDYAGYIEQWPELAVVAAAVVLFFVGAFFSGVLVTHGEVPYGD